MPGSEAIAHCVMFSDLAQCKAGQRIEIDGDEAHHAARVKRVRPGERLLLLDGAGHLATGVLESIGGSRSKPILVLDLGPVSRKEAIEPRVEIWAALPKGDRLDRMIDQMTQLGVSRYRPLLCDRSQRKPDSLRPEKLSRIGDEAMKQCRRPWRMQIDEPIAFQEALGDPDAVIADAAGQHWEAQSSCGARIVVLVGPEGGWSNTERGLFVEAGVPVRCFGRFVLRIEAAACAAAAIVMGVSPSGAQ
ncbi:MAG: RsmE family RNA methyltransferase [Phycisphaerales bacterium JB052]